MPELSRGMRTFGARSLRWAWSAGVSAASSHSPSPAAFNLAIGADDAADSGGEGDDDDEDGPDLLRVRLTADAARSFVERAFRVIRAGRPPCPLCGNPLDAAGHICPRKNGHYVH